MVYVLSVVSAFFYGVAAVMQHREAASAPGEQHMRFGLLVHLVKRPVWAAGIVADVIAFLFQALALGQGPLTLVQPLLTAGLLFALVLAAAWDRRRLTGFELLAALALMTGLTLFLIAASPSPGRATVSFRRWWIAGVLVGVGVAVLVGWARRISGRAARWRPALLGIAASLTFAISDALIKSGIDVLHAHGLVELLDTWYLYALAGLAVLGALLVQSAFQAGPLAMSLPALTAVEPVASSGVGVILFAETLRTSPGALAGELVAAALSLFGIWVLGRSPTVTGTRSLSEKV
ncbi:MAG TPA: DMT family transporter [Actinomycetota bacterium]|nr:DMT family transporter [Actinomycetota bacterium]